MKITSVLATVFTLVFATSAIAQGNLKEIKEPNAKPDCKIVTIERPNVTAPSIQVRIGNPSIEIKGGTMADMIKACNSDAAGSGFMQIMPITNNGADVRIKATVGDVGVAKLALPISLTESKMETVVCLRTPAADGSKHAKYATAWSSTLPEKIVLTKLDSYDKAAADRGCGSLQASN
jgi:hypothetical protein